MYLNLLIITLFYTALVNAADREPKPVINFKNGYEIRLQNEKDKSLYDYIETRFRNFLLIQNIDYEKHQTFLKLSLYMRKKTLNITALCKDKSCRVLASDLSLNKVSYNTKPSSIDTFVLPEENSVSPACNEYQSSVNALTGVAEIITTLPGELLVSKMVDENSCKDSPDFRKGTSNFMAHLLDASETNFPTSLFSSCLRKQGFSDRDLEYLQAHSGVLKSDAALPRIVCDNSIKVSQFTAPSTILLSTAGNSACLSYDIIHEYGHFMFDKRVTAFSKEGCAASKTEPCAISLANCYATECSNKTVSATILTASNAQLSAEKGIVNIDSPKGFSLVESGFTGNGSTSMGINQLNNMVGAFLPNAIARNPNEFSPSNFGPGTASYIASLPKNAPVDNILEKQEHTNSTVLRPDQGLLTEGDKNPHSIESSKGFKPVPIAKVPPPSSDTSSNDTGLALRKPASTQAFKSSQEGLSKLSPSQSKQLTESSTKKPLDSYEQKIKKALKMLNDALPSSPEKLEDDTAKLIKKFGPIFDDLNARVKISDKFELGSERTGAKVYVVNIGNPKNKKP